MTRKFGIICALLCVEGLSTSGGAAIDTNAFAESAPVGQAAVVQEPSWLAKADASNLKTRAYADPSGRFTVEYPAKNWRMVSGGVSSLVIFEQNKNEASIAIERDLLMAPLQQSNVNDKFAKLEIEDLARLDPKVGTAEHRILEAGDRRVAALTFARPGQAGGSDQVRLYVMVQGDSLYRITCRAAPHVWAKYESIFAHVAATFTVIPST